jgi:hypothetical protein
MLKPCLASESKIVQAFDGGLIMLQYYQKQRFERKVHEKAIIGVRFSKYGICVLTFRGRKVEAFCEICATISNIPIAPQDARF